MNRPDKLECYITQGWKGLPETNTLDCWDHLLAVKKKKCFEYDSWGRIRNTSLSSKVMNGPNKLECFPWQAFPVWCN
jgi:hypothetical protein